MKHAIRMVVAVAALAQASEAQQVMWKDNPITGKVVGLTYGVATWPEAESLAVSYGGHLLTLDGAADEAWVLSQFSTHWPSTPSFPVAGFGPWIGLNDMAAEGVWQWSSGSNSSYRNWSSSTGEPNDANGGEDYVQFGIESLQWRWNDNSGQHRTRALIEVGQRPPRSWSWPTAYSTGVLPLYGCAIDMDNDGDFDYASPDRGSGQISFWRNDGTGGFTASGVVMGVGSPHTLVPFDHDSDGDMDLYATDFGGRLLLVRNGGASWTMEMLAVIPGCFGVAPRDFNGDSIVDFVTVACDGYANQGDDRVRVLIGLSGGGYYVSGSYGVFDECYEPYIADLDRDGVLDILVSGNTVRILRGVGGGQFVEVGILGSGRSVNCMAIDLDRDGVLEIVLGRAELDSFEVWKLSRQGSFDAGDYIRAQSLPSGDGTHRFGSGDLDGDGDLDFAVPAALSDTIHIWRNDAGVLAQDHVLLGSGRLFHCIAEDFTSDRKADIVASNHFGNSITFYVNQSTFDCNGNSIDDPLDIASGFSTDCNSNGRPDSCDAAIPANDCNGDSILDACQLTALTDCNSNARLDTCDLAAGAPDCDGNQILDVCEPLTAANDCDANGQLDICQVLAGAPDCNFNNRPDVCDVAAGAPDCNLNAVPDDCDIGVGSSVDLDFNSIPDECSLDCNGNGLLDTAEVQQGLTPDCNANLVPDSCDVAGAVPDCNANGVPDSCDVAAGQDCDANGVPDVCDLTGGAADCNGNGVLDVCDLAAGGVDCNGNLQLDGCELAAGAADCNGNGVLDSCDVAAGAGDCDGNAVPDVCQALDASNDCNVNGVLDVCDVLAGAPDCNGDQVPDACQSDANGDGVMDDCQDGGTAYCFGSGAGSTACPCGGVGAAGAGCPNSTNPSGAALVAVGLPSRIADSLVLQGSGMPPSASVLYFQGTSQAQVPTTGAFGTVFGDGLRCAAGVTVRLGFRTNVGGASAIPSAGSAALHVVGQVPATGAVTRYYQAWYRDASPSFCTTNRYNLTNGVAVVWVP